MITYLRKNRKLWPKHIRIIRRSEFPCVKVRAMKRPIRHGGRSNAWYRLHAAGTRVEIVTRLEWFRRHARKRLTHPKTKSRIYRTFEQDARRRKRGLR